MMGRSPLYRITVELLESGHPEYNSGLVGLYCFDTGRRPLEMTRIDSNTRRFSFDLRTSAIGMYIASPGHSFTYGPWYQSPTRKAVEGDIL